MLHALAVKETSRNNNNNKKKKNYNNNNNNNNGFNLNNIHTYTENCT